jgi:hypothetical protein
MSSQMHHSLQSNSQSLRSNISQSNARVAAPSVVITDVLLRDAVSSWTSQIRADFDPPLHSWGIGLNTTVIACEKLGVTVSLVYSIQDRSLILRTTF